MEMLREGTRGRHVRRWQTFLVDRGFLDGPADGVFGKRTRAATIAYQRAHGVVADGLVGPQTAAVADWLVDRPPIGHAPAPDGTRVVLTEVMLRQIMPRIPPALSAACAPRLQRAMEEFGIDTTPRAAAFLAQLAHESSELRCMEEIWGPTPAQRRYEPPTRLAARLGNTEPGDGKRFKGRGPIQLTGRANYRRYGRALGVDLVGNPALAATSEVGFRIAGLFWKLNGLNQLADARRFKAITRRINGGFNGLPDRVRFYERAKRCLQVPAVPAAAPTEPAPPHFPRGLDAPGAITPTGAERSLGRATGRTATRTPARPRKKGTTRRPAARASRGRKRPAPRAAAGRARSRAGMKRLRKSSRKPARA
jgi:predicted chitinase